MSQEAFIYLLKRVYQATLPQSFRTSRAMMWLKSKAVPRLPHDVIYDHHYYMHSVEGPASRASTIMAKSIVSKFKVDSLIDVGCGTGAFIAAVRECGCEVFGLEYSAAGMEFCRKRNLDVRKFDLETDILTERKTFDVVCSFEVAEHLPEYTADRFVDLLVNSAPVVALTAARPGQGGSDHVNEQPAEYWIEKFASRRFTFDGLTSRQISDAWRKSGVVAEWYWQNLMIFRRNSAA